MTLESLGWRAFFSDAFDQYRASELIPARITQEHRNGYLAYSRHGEFRAELAGSFRHRAGSRSRSERPAVGDWVALQFHDNGNQTMIHGVLPRASAFSRKVAGVRSEEQVVAANIDTVFIVAGLDGNFNPRRIERALILAWESGAQPVVVLNKCDLSDALDAQVAEMRNVALGVPVLTASATEGSGLEALTAYAGPGKTVALIGSSGVGKSSITNRLAGMNVQKVEYVSESVGKGRHTTTRRELISLPSGGAIIDTPGMRELQLWDGDQGIGETFDDVEELAAQCRFRDCDHRDEPGCAVAHALADGRLDAGRFGNYRKMQREIAYLASRQDTLARRQQTRAWKRIHMELRRGRR